MAPEAPVSLPPLPAPPVAAASTAVEEAAPAKMPGWRVPMAAGTPLTEYLYWALLVAIVPLLISMFHKQDDVGQRFEQTVSHASAELQEKVQEVKEKLEIQGPMPAGAVAYFPKQFFAQLPNDQLDGALLARESWAHWSFALLSAAAFFALVVYMFPLGAVTRPRMLIVGLFTGTMGILLLLAFQFLAAWTQGLWIRGRGIIVLLFYIVKLIGWAYDAAEDPANGFLLSFLAFTFSVGMCEELCKIVPLIGHFKSESGPSWRGACMWALASGVGFGVAEGIMYSGRYYNGIEGGEIYLVRFVSCVALHATWAAAAGISLFRHRDKIGQDEDEPWLSSLAMLVAIIFVPMVLHGLYDTLLKKEMDLLAAATAVASFLWLVRQVESMRKWENALPVRTGRRAGLAAVA